MALGIGNGKNESWPGLEGKDRHISNYSLGQLAESSTHHPHGHLEGHYAKYNQQLQFKWKVPPTRTHLVFTCSSLQIELSPIFNPLLCPYSFKTHLAEIWGMAQTPTFPNLLAETTPLYFSEPAYTALTFTSIYCAVHGRQHSKSYHMRSVLREGTGSHSSLLNTQQ